LVKVRKIKILDVSICLILLCLKIKTKHLKPLKQMKKLFTALSIILGLGLASAQQVTPAKTTTAPPAKGAKMTTVTKPAAKPAMAAKPAANSGMKLKKDGTPDKRYKSNQHLKKDGTPDKRYKTK
jgi:hypothetical protein